MTVCKPDEIIIHGTTHKGKVFRPSDWAERLCGILSSFNKDNRLSYSEWVQPVLLDKVRCVAVSPALKEINPAMYRFLMDFASDNNLRVLTYADLTAEARQYPPPAVPPPEPVAVPAAAVETVVAVREKAVLREIPPHETAAAFPALSVLRPKLKDTNGFVEQVNKIQRQQGYRLLGIFEEGSGNAVAVCGFREKTNLVSGRHIHIDDLVTLPPFRKQGYGTRLLEEVQRIAREAGVTQIQIDSNVGGERTTAHRIYFQHGFEISAYHFVCHIGR